MLQDDYLTLSQAADLARKPKRELRDLVRAGKLPAIRRGGQWQVQRADVTRLGHTREVAVSAAGSVPAPRGETPESGHERGDMLALLEILRQRDEHIAKLQDDRVRLAGQVGYLQAQLEQRDLRLKLLEAAAIEPGSQRRLAETAVADRPDAIDRPALLDVPSEAVPASALPREEAPNPIRDSENGAARAGEASPAIEDHVEVLPPAEVAPADVIQPAPVAPVAGDAPAHGEPSSDVESDRSQTETHSEPDRGMAAWKQTGVRTGDSPFPGARDVPNLADIPEPVVLVPVVPAAGKTSGEISDGSATTGAEEQQSASPPVATVQQPREPSGDGRAAPGSRVDETDIPASAPRGAPEPNAGATTPDRGAALTNRLADLSYQARERVSGLRRFLRRGER